MVAAVLPPPAPALRLGLAVIMLMPMMPRTSGMTMLDMLQVAALQQMIMRLRQVLMVHGLLLMISRKSLSLV